MHTMQLKRTFDKNENPFLSSVYARWFSFSLSLFLFYHFETVSHFNSSRWMTLKFVCHTIRLPVSWQSSKWNQRHQCWRCIPLQLNRMKSRTEKKKKTQTCVTYFYLPTSSKHKEVEKVLDIWYACCFFTASESAKMSSLSIYPFQWILKTRMFQQAHFFGINYPFNRIITLAFTLEQAKEKKKSITFFSLFSSMLYSHTPWQEHVFRGEKKNETRTQT